MNSEEVRKLFLDFFKERGHKIVPSSSLIPLDDFSVLLTTAGMQQFKKYYTREKNPDLDFSSQRVASVQKCFRTTDIEEIGDETHLTFFEMLGNFSFGPVKNDDPSDFTTGGYFKKASIYWAYEFLQKLNLKIDFVTVFKGEREIGFDKESYDTWLEIGIKPENILQRGREDNFWGPTGDEGPCGPTTEIYIDGVEIWNLVFNEYYQDKNGKISKLKYPGVDTGMGFERLMKAVQNSKNIFETDIFKDFFDYLNNVSKVEDIRKKRIVIDHLRGAVFLVADGLYPSNLERGYVLRRILRRLTLNFKFLNLNLENLENLITLLIEKYKDFYPEIKNFVKIRKVIFEEISLFEKTLKLGMKEFYKQIKGDEDEEKIAEKLFLLYTSYGLPLEISKEILKENNMVWTQRSQAKFDELFKKHQEISKK